MIDPGYDYQDAAMQPPEPPEPTPADDYEECKHAEACRSLFERLRGREVDEDGPFWLVRLAADLGCEGCQCWTR